MKRMNKLIFLGLLSLATACSTETPSGLKITGNAQKLSEGDEVYIEVVGTDGVKPLDTMILDAEGSFLTYLDVEEPSFYRLNFKGKQIVTLILSGEDQQVTINVEGDNPQGFVEVSGSYDTEYKNQIDDLMKSYRQEIQQFQQRQIQARQNNDAAGFQVAQQQMMNLARKTEKELKDKIREISPSLAAFYGLQMIDPAQNFAFMDSIATELSVEMPNNFHVQGLLDQMNAKRTVSIGAIAPELELQNPEGKMVKLSSLRGKYVLIDFWAAWCRPCRAENPNVVRMYNKYANENFEIYGVSLDKTREAWLKAIEQDGLPWVHVSDLKFWNSIAAQKYSVNAIPATFLIDPDGKIIAKNLRGASLEAKLEEIFG